MRCSVSAVLLGLSALAVHAAPQSSGSQGPNGAAFPNDGFPNPSPAQLAAIEKRAFGTLPNSPLPTKLSQQSITNFQVIAQGEIFEVAYFHSLLQNVTQKKPGYEVPQGQVYGDVVKILDSILAQEELHALAANAALKTAGQQQVQPCGKYMFPVSDFASAIKLAATFTDLVLGTLQDVNAAFVQNQDSPGLARILSSIIGEEAEQEGIFRLYQKQVPNALPFLTTGQGIFAFTAIQSFSPAGSCPNVKNVKLPTLKSLTVLDTPQAKTSNIRYAIPASSYKQGTKLYVTYINQQNKPIVEPLTYQSTQGSNAIFSGSFPYDANKLNGYTLASVSSCAGPYADADAVAQKAEYGPGNIIVTPANAMLQ